LTSDPVVVFAPNWLGDAIMALPAIADIQRHFSPAPVVVAARSSVASLFELVPDVHRIATLQWRARAFTGRQFHEDVFRIREACQPGVRGAGAVHGVAVLLTNSFATAWLAKRVPVVERWGYATDWRGRLLTRRVRVPVSSMHQASYYQHLTAELGMARGPLEARVDVADALQQQARDRLRAAGWDGSQPLVTMAPGAAYGTAKRWPPAHFARVIAQLAQERQAQVVLVGSAADAETIRTITSDEAVRRARPIDLAGRTSLRELAAVLAASAACLSNDSGAMHLAGAIGTPLIAVFGPTRDAETAPLTRTGGRREVLINEVWCRPCMLRECPIDHRCMRGLPPDGVLAALARALD
jgi:heptosyltransferase-2